MGLEVVVVVLGVAGRSFGVDGVGLEVVVVFGGERVVVGGGGGGGGLVVVRGVVVVVVVVVAESIMHLASIFSS